MTDTRQTRGAGPKEGLGDLVDLIKDYARQETVDPLKGAGRWVGFGLLGSVIVVLLFGALVWRTLQIARDSAVKGRFYQAYLAFGIGAWQGLQAFINVGVNMGVLPTKGLPLPLVSFGRSSVIVTLIALALLLRIDWENRQPVPRRRLPVLPVDAQ